MRSTAVHSLRVISVQISSSILIGDCVAVSPRSYALAVKRTVPAYWVGEEHPGSLRTFSRPVPEVPSITQTTVKIDNPNPVINVGAVEVMTISAASVMQIGNSAIIDTDTRTRNVRHLIQAQTPVPPVSPVTPVPPS